MNYFTLIILFILLVSTFSFAEETHHHQKHAQSTLSLGIEKLSHDLRHLLSQEMQALQSGMMAIIPAYVSGNWAEIQIIAEKMKSSYILKQSLTESQIKELHSVLPPEFIKLDQRFHYLAGMLEHAAQTKKPELINFYYSEMNQACVGCHTTFATYKFPNLAPIKKSVHHH